MAPKKKPGPRGARGAGPGQQLHRTLPPGNSDPGIDIVFGNDGNKSKPVRKPKGHRQRGAGTVMVDRGAVERDGVAVLSWQRLPSQLVQQHADRLQLKAPRYQSVEPTEPGMFRSQIVIPDRKNSAKDLHFLPTVSFSTAAQAKEHAALLALLKLQEDQPLERKLPEPYKTTWLQNVAEAKGESQRPLARWEKAKKAREAKEQEEMERKKAESSASGSEASAPGLGSATQAGDVGKASEEKKDVGRKAAQAPAPMVLKAVNEFASKFEAQRAKEQKETAAKDVKRKEEAWARSNSDMKVMMSGRIRKLLEEALGLSEERERQREIGVDFHGLSADALEGSERAVFERIKGMGFPDNAVLRAMVACRPMGDESDAVKREDTLLEWLCLHLEEDELPKGFDPRGRMLDVIRPGEHVDAGTAASAGGVEVGGDGPSASSPSCEEDTGAEGGLGPLGKRLRCYGFGHADVREAIAASVSAAGGASQGGISAGEGDEESGLEARVLAPLAILVRGLTHESDHGAVVRGPVQSLEEGLEAADEEAMSLEAIYLDDVRISLDMPKGSYLFTFDLKTLASMAVGEAWLDVWILRAGGEGGYPAQAPAVALVRGSDDLCRHAGALRAAQAALAKRAADLVGSTAVYDLLVWAVDELPGILASSPVDGGELEAKEAVVAVGRSARNQAGRDTGVVLDSTQEAAKEMAGSRSGRGGAVIGGAGIIRRSGADGRGRDGHGGGGQWWGAVGEGHQRRSGPVVPAVPPAERKRGRERVETSREFTERRRQRQALPAAKARSEFLEMVRDNQVVLVSGETGCGKTTQIPQFLLEEWEDGSGPGGFRALVTQPRRIAAVGVAQRVAEERCEEVGAGVGYQIRGESKAGPETRLVFCTTGLLLRRMQGDPSLQGLTHLIVDEVHERHLDADFLLALLIGILPTRPKLKVILMSATLDTKRFAAYFAGIPGACSVGKDGEGLVPVLHIPGRTFPVRDLYLEDALALTGRRPRLKRRMAARSSIAGNEKRDSGSGTVAGGALPAAKHWLTGEDEEDDDGDDGGDGGDGGDVNPEEEEVLRQRERESGTALGGIDWDTIDEEYLDYELIAALILFVTSSDGERQLGLRGAEAEKVDGRGGGRRAGGASGRDGRQGPVGSVLVFMPGTSEIDRLCRELEQATEGSRELWVLPLHGSLPPHKQREVFEPPPRGSRKVVVSTNIAETSITIPDVTVVVDSCRVKEMGYDIARQMPRLQQAWASQDSLTQRKGRAGRVREGVSFKLIRRRTFSKLSVHGTPEIRRVPLDPLVLQVKALGVKEHPSVVLGRALDPPDPKAVQDAVDTLTELKALGEGAELTPLGWHLAALPCPVQVGKMLVYGAVLGCLSRVLSIAAGLSCRSPFIAKGPGGARQAVDAAKKRMAEVGGGRSDHTLLAVAVEDWDALGDGEIWGGGRGGGGRRNPGVDRARKQFCSSNGLSLERMRELVDVREQLAQGLASIGFISSPRTAFSPDASVNAQAGSWRAVKAAVCAGLYPRVMRVRRPMERYVDLVGIGAVPVQQKAKEFQFFTRAPARSAVETTEPGGGEGGATAIEPWKGSSSGGPEAGVDQEVFIHPASINYTTNDWSCPWLVYHERVHTSQVFVRDCTEVSPFALLLFGGRISVQAGQGRIAVDDWVRFEAIGRIAALVNKLRQRLDAMLWEKIQNPRVDVAGSKLSEALVELLQTDGMG